MRDLPPLPWRYARIDTDHDVAPDSIDIEDALGQRIATVTGPAAFQIARLLTSDRFTCELLEAPDAR